MYMTGCLGTTAAKLCILFVFVVRVNVIPGIFSSKKCHRLVQQAGPYLNEHRHRIRSPELQLFEEGDKLYKAYPTGCYSVP